MIQTQETKMVMITPPGAIIDNASLTTASIDRKGWDYIDIYVMLGATDIAMTALKVQQSDTDSAYADITGANFATGTQSDGSAAALPSATDDNKFFHFGINLLGKKRWLDVVATGGDGAAGAYITIFAVLSRGQTTPSSLSGRGMTGEIYV